MNAGEFGNFGRVRTTRPLRFRLYVGVAVVFGSSLVPSIFLSLAVAANVASG
jgi:hypothetical protein